MTVMGGTVSPLQHEQAPIVAGLDEIDKSLYSPPLSQFRRLAATQNFLNIMTTVQQISTYSARTAGRNAFACAAVMAGTYPIAFTPKSCAQKPWLHGERDPYKHPGPGDA
jgi:hypothetical protein